MEARASMNVLARIRGWLAPPVFEDDEEKSNAATVLNTILLMVLVPLLLYLVSAVLSRSTMQPFVFVVVLIMLVTCAGSFVLLRQRQVRLAGLVMLLLFWLAFTLGAAAFGGIHDEAILGYMVLIVLVGILLGRSGLVAFTVLIALSIVGLYAAEQMHFITPTIDLPSLASDLILIVLLVTITAALLGYNVQRMTRLHNSARENTAALEESNTALEASRDALAKQSADLVRRARYLEATAALARETTLETDIRALLPRLARIVGDQLGFYHVGIFFLEPNREWLSLQAASSEGGRRMLARGHRLRMREGLVGNAAAQRRYRVLMDVGRDSAERTGTAQDRSAHTGEFFDNPDLPETHSEAALPLMARGPKGAWDVIGVLDVQSTERNAFTDEDLVALQVLANQLAVALSNARLYWEAQRALESERGAYGELSRQAWQELFRTQPELSIVRDRRGIVPGASRPDEEVRQALQTGKAVVGGDGQDVGQSPGLAVPIRVRGQIIGAIDAHKPAGTGGWTQEQILLLEMLGEQVGDALEDARLYRDAQRRAARERALSEVSGRVRESLDVDVVLQRAVQEMRQALGVAEVEVRLDPIASPAAAVAAGAPAWPPEEQGEE